MIMYGIFTVAVFITFVEYSLTKNIILDKITSSTECTNDIKQSCNKVEKNDVALLMCLQDPKISHNISFPCQHSLWLLKSSLTTSAYFDGITMELCAEDLKTINECQHSDLGHRIPCLLDYADKIDDEKCTTFIQSIDVLIFSDYHLIFNFIEKCKTDINKYGCGRIAQNGMDKDGPRDDTTTSFKDYISQSRTLDCLIDEWPHIEADCHSQILHLSELQSNDYHLNRRLYLACHNDKQMFCEHVKSGEGRVYSCLMKAKFSAMMSEKCKEQLTRKQQIESGDFEANYPIFHHCKKDIIHHKCIEQTTSHKHDIVKMSVVLVCLNNAKRNGESLSPKCVTEITERELEMFEDFKISSDALAACKDDVKSHCEQLDKKPGAVVHCLMQLAEPDLNNKEGKLSPICKRTVMRFLEETNPANTIMASDIVIKEACMHSFFELCPDLPSEEEAFYCLTHHIKNPKMDPKCRDKITNILYFSSLDIKIDPNINRACHEDAVRLCNGPNTVEKTIERTVKETQLEYHCMYENFKNDHLRMELAQARGQSTSNMNFSLSLECSDQIFNLINIQSSNIKLDLSVFYPCFEDLGRYCADSKFKGKEHECLQTNIKQLERKCRKAIVNFSQIQDLDSRLNNMISEACKPMLRLFCPQESKENYLVCLEKHKFHARMSTNCHASIEHLQILRLEEFHIDHRFASFCGPEIAKYCEKESISYDGVDVSKAKIVSCLSTKIIEQILNGFKHPLSDECRQQFSFELLQRSETITLDPSLFEDCASEITEFCSKSQQNEINACLRDNQNKLQDKCHKRLFKRERLEALDADFDGELHQKCSQMIEERCHDVPGPKVFSCLHRNMNDVEFDKDCGTLVMSRLIRRMNDFRLNPELVTDCSRDISKYCHIDSPVKDSPKSGIEYDGLVFSCLKEQYTNNSDSLEPDCQLRVQMIMIEAHRNSKLDPVLHKQCSQDIKQFCTYEVHTNRLDNADGVTNCLKIKFLRNLLNQDLCKREVQRLLIESRADIHLDIDLFEACQKALATACRSRTFGNGHKIRCLLSLINEKDAMKIMGPVCIRVLKEREEMWSKAGNSESHSLTQLFHHVTQSSTSVYLLSMLGLMIVALILLGVCCGRVTKRVSVDVKNK